MDTLSEKYTFLKHSQALKEVYRIPIRVGERKESSAEHSWSVAFLAWFLLPELEKEFQQKIDAGRIVAMAIIHDLVELEISDTSVWDKKKRKIAEQKENKSFDELMKSLSIQSSHEMRDLWNEFQEQQTLESKLVKGADRLSAAMQRVSSGQGWTNDGHNESGLDSIQLSKISFSKVLLHFYMLLKNDAKNIGLLKT